MGIADHQVITMGERLLRLKEVEAKTGIGRSSVYKYMSEGRFPLPLQLGPGTVRWKQSEIDEWIDSLPVNQYPDLQ